MDSLSDELFSSLSESSSEAGSDSSSEASSSSSESEGRGRKRQSSGTQSNHTAMLTGDDLRDIPIS